MHDQTPLCNKLATKTPWELTDWWISDWTFTRPGFPRCLEQNYCAPDYSFLSPPLFHVPCLPKEMWTRLCNLLQNNQVVFMCSGSRKVNINCQFVTECEYIIIACMCTESCILNHPAWIKFLGFVLRHLLISYCMNMIENKQIVLCDGSSVWLLDASKKCSCWFCFEQQQCKCK